ncbi:MAG TPA: FecR family protein [Polyangiaceae bacterium]|nr:FecR family protein [Polyangiaceae bacterium]
MTEPSKALERALELGRTIEPRLGAQDLERLQRQIRDRSAKARLGTPMRFAVVMAAAALLFAGSREAWLRGTHVEAVAAGAPTAVAAAVSSVSAPAPPGRLPSPLVLSDRSRVQPRDSGTELSVVEDSPTNVRVKLTRGRGHFEVAPGTERVFSVLAGGVEVTVLGTVFDVEVVADRVGVDVERGSVRVNWKLGAAELTAGQSGWFPPLVVDERRDTPPRAPGPPAPAASSIEASTPESAQSLLKQADAARAGGDAALGAQLLRRVLREHAKDPRASLAALTLGRLLLTELHRPAEAAAAFAQVELHAPGSPFADDALAHQAEAWQAAGQAAKAQQLATSYLKRYPSGRHARHMRALAESE